MSGWRSISADSAGTHFSDEAAPSVAFEDDAVSDRRHAIALGGSPLRPWSIGGERAPPWFDRVARHLIELVCASAAASAKKDGYMNDVHRGGCLCGAVRYEARGTPTRTQACHCTFCQRFTGAPYFAETLFPTENVSFSGEPTRVYEHRSDGSGKIVRLHFCSTCGTTVSLQFERFPQVRALARGTFDDPNRFSIGAHLFTASAQRGVAFAPGADCFEGHRIGLDGLPNSSVKHAEPALGPRGI